jgi:hypothetical protein
MSDDKPEPTQKTPKGAEIPIPKREDVERDLRKLIAPERSDKPEVSKE